MISQFPQINLYRLADSTFTLAHAQSDSLYLIAGDATTQAPLAKALLTVLRDTIFPIELPAEPVQGRSSSGPETNEAPNSQQQLLLIPNPASGVVKVLLPDEMPEATVKLFDINGREVRSLRVVEWETVIPISSLQGGIYLVKASNGTLHYQAKLVIQR